MNPVMGAETEYAVALIKKKTGKRMQPERECSLIMKTITSNVPCMESLDGQGVFTASSAKFYIDIGNHPEYATPECASPKELTRYILAGDRLMRRASRVIEAGGQVTPMVFRGNTGYGSHPASWACHESYQCKHSPLRYSAQLAPFLASRLIYAGSGGFNPYAAGIEFSVSPRSHFINCVENEDTTRHRPIVNLRDQTHSGGGWHRLHLIVADSIGSETAMWLRAGATALAIGVIDAGYDAAPGLSLKDPLAAMRTFAADTSLTADVPTTEGGCITAIEIQRRYLDAASRLFEKEPAKLPTWAPSVLAGWRNMLDMLASTEVDLERILDWRTKLAVYRDICESSGIAWSSLPDWNVALSALSEAKRHATDEESVSLETLCCGAGATGKHARRAVEHLQMSGLNPADVTAVEKLKAELIEIDTRFLQIDGLFERLSAAGELQHQMLEDEEVESAVDYPPDQPRAALRGTFVREHSRENPRYRVGWTQVSDLEEMRCADIADPFSASLEWKQYQRQSQVPSHMIMRMTALDAYVSGNYIEARILLDRLLESDYELHSTLCHLARLAIVTDSLDEAREFVTRVWEIRESAPSSIIPRILWMRIAMAMLGHSPDRVMQPYIRAMGPAIEAAGSNEWTMDPVLNHLAGRMPHRHHALLSGIAAAISDNDCLGELEELPQWTEAVSGD